MKLQTTDKQFDEIHHAIDKARKNAKDVKVSRQTIVNLLMDHSNFVTELGKNNINVETDR